MYSGQSTSRQRIVTESVIVLCLRSQANCSVCDYGVLSCSSSEEGQEVLVLMWYVLTMDCMFCCGFRVNNWGVENKVTC